MPTITVRNLAGEVQRALRLRAAANNRSVEAEIRMILATVALPPARVRLGTELAMIGERVGGLVLRLPGEKVPEKPE